MVQIVPAGQLNIAALQTDDVYINIVAPPAFIVGVPTDVFGIVGTASWGPVNTPVLLGNSQAASSVFGSVSSVSLTDPYDLPTDLYLAFGQGASSASLQGWGVRVTDGTDTAASVSITGTSASAESLTCTAPGSPGTLYSVQMLVSTVAVATVTYTSVTGDTATTVAAALTKAINLNAALFADGVYAKSTAGVVTLYYPSALSAVTFVVSSNVTAAAGTASTAGITLTAKYTGVLGNQISVAITQNTGNGKYNVSVNNPFGPSENFPNINAANFFQSLQAAINSGLSGVRGPSIYLTATNANGAVAPTVNTSSLTSGTDGRLSVSTATLIGSSSAFPPTGMYALANLKPAVGVAWLVGCVDQSTPALLNALGLSSGFSVLCALPNGITTATALTTIATNGVQSPALAYVTDWIYFFDAANNQNRLVPPTAVIGGYICTTTPQSSPGNDPVNLILGTVRNNPITGNLPYSPSEIGQLENAGIMLITNPIPAGQEFGIRHGQTTSANTVTQPFEYWRMTSYLARSIGNSMGGYVDQLQSQQPIDPLRQAVKLELNNFLSLLQGLGQIDGFLVTCAFSASPSAVPGLGMNTPASIAQHYLFVLVQVTYLSSVRFFVISLQGGTTVVTVSSGATSGPV